MNLETYYHRREFLQKLMRGIGVISLGSFTVSILDNCSGTGGMGPRDGIGTITVDFSLLENQALANVGGVLAIGKNDLDSHGLLIYRDSATTAFAFSRRCTHQGCTIDGFVNTIAACPCHGSSFDLDGQVITGPASRPLTRYTTSLSGTIITITGD